MSTQNLQMSKPTFTPLGELSNVKSNKQFLLNTSGFKTVQQAKKSFGFNNAIETYDFLFDDYNSNIKQINEANLKKYNKDLATYNKVAIVNRYKKYIKQLNLAYNRHIWSIPFVDTSMSSQISTKFALGEHSMKLKFNEIMTISDDGSEKIHEFTDPNDFLKITNKTFKYSANEAKVILLFVHFQEF